MDKKIKERYFANKSAKVKDELVCPICGSKFIKKQYAQAFCCAGCKDKFWNKKCSNRHKNPNYHHDYNMKHPERILRVMPTLTARDRDERFAMSEYLHDENFKRYVDQEHEDDESMGRSVDLITEWNNYMGID